MDALKIPGRSQGIAGRVIIHHSKTADSETLSWQAVRKWHVEHNGWDDVGYHAGIELIGDQFECFFGRPFNRTGAHCRGQNIGSLGLCFIGDYDEDPPSDLMMHTAAQRVIAPWLHLMQKPVGCITGDRDWHHGKTCPGSQFDLDKLREIVTLYL